MPNQPTLSAVHINRPLSTLSTAFIQRPTTFVHNQAFPNVPVPHRSDLYWTYPRGYWFRTIAAKRGPGTESVGGGFDMTPAQYIAEPWAVHMDIDDQTRANADDGIKLYEDATLWVTTQLMLRRELEFYSNYLATGVWQGYAPGGTPADFAPSTAGAGYWDSATSNPMKDIDALKAAVWGTTGYEANTLILTQNVYFALRNHPIVLDRIKYTQRGLITTDLLATLFGVDKILVAGAVFNTSQEGQTPTIGFGASNKFLLCYAAPNPGLRMPSAGYIFSWTGYAGAGEFGNRVRSFRIEERESERVEGTMAFQMARVGADLGVLGINVLQNP